jgi:predicted phage tail protein
MSQEYRLKNTCNYHDELIKLLQNSENANAYLEVAIEEFIEDHNAQALLLALENLVEAGEKQAIKDFLQKFSNRPTQNYQSLSQPTSLTNHQIQPQSNTLPLIPSHFLGNSFSTPYHLEELKLQ